MIRAALFAVAFLAASGAQGQVHKCVDAAGKVIYTQDPCPANTKPGSISRSVIQAPAAAPAAAAAKESEQKSAEAQRKAENCRNARERLTQYEIGGRQSRINEKGERYYLEDAQIEQEKARARSDVAQSCN